MKIKKNSKIFACLLAILLVLPLLSSSVSALGWPLDVSATENQEVGKEESPNAIEQSFDVDLSSTSNSVDAIDNSTTSLDNDVIFPESEYGLANRLMINSSSEELSEAERIYSNYKDVVPKVTVDQAVEWILKKGNELISILQIFAQPFAIIIFIVSCAVCLIGALSKGNMMGKGFIGMVASAILYAAALYAPVLVNSISSFLSS